MEAKCPSKVREFVFLYGERKPCLNEAILVAIGWTGIMYAAYASAGGMMPFVMALKSIRIRQSERAVSLTSLDAIPMARTGIVLWAVPPLLLVLGMRAVLIGGSACLVLWFGFRLTVQVSPTQTRLVRKFAFFIPWSQVVYPDPPRVFTDGWGDFLDPEALHIALGGGKQKIELAWGDKWSGSRCEDLAAEFNEAVVKLRC